MNQEQILEVLSYLKDIGANEAYQIVERFRINLVKNDGNEIVVNLDVFDNGIDSNARYYSRAESEDGTLEVGNPSNSIFSAISEIKWDAFKDID